MFLFHVPYTTMQYVGLGFLFSLYLFQGLKFVVYDLPREKKREAELKEEVERLDKKIQEHKSSAPSRHGSAWTASPVGIEFISEEDNSMQASLLRQTAIFKSQSLLVPVVETISQEDISCLDVSDEVGESPF